ncbi:hypothetical protein FACS1894110_24010 [Spirochaetia bacterium]|nr:hypothetical protein FACS1894110_24010 [Spirochaetia bacterium]
MGTWKCTKCSASTWSTIKPLVGACMKGGGHRWVAADSNTPVIWRCSKCGNMMPTSNRPGDRPCVRGGKCTWRKR